MRGIDLKIERQYIEQYINLRNRYLTELMTSEIKKEGTIKWLNDADAEVRCILDGQVMLGVVIVFVERGGEISFFVGEKNRGIGTMLLGIGERIARERNLPSIWAWVLKDNYIAQHAFEKCAFMEDGWEVRNRNGLFYEGKRYKKVLL